MVLFGIPHRSTYYLLENVVVDGSDDDPISYEGDKASAILFDSYKRRSNGFFKVKNKSGKETSGVITDIWATSIERGHTERFTYKEWKILSNEFVEIIEDVYYRPSKVIPPDYEI